MNNDYGNLDLHMALLSAMKDIDKICRENGLKYYLHAGTLLGAVNHRGFIPWDDDVDITMLREDYERFVLIIQQEYNEKYFLQNYETDPMFKNNRAVLRILGTELLHYHEDTTTIHKEIGVDIAPLYPVPDFKVFQKIQQSIIWVLDAAVQIKLGDIIPKHPIMKCIGLLSKLDRVKLGKMIDSVMKLWKSNKTDKLGVLCYTGRNPYTGVSGYYNDVMPRIWYENPKYIAFEDTELLTISSPHEDLTFRYGPNYMEPYPEEKRVTKHDIKSYEISKKVRKRLGL